MEENIIVTQLNQVMLILLNRPEKRNSLNADIVRELYGALRSAEHDDSIRVVVLGAEGPAFCAGADLDYLMQISMNSPLENVADSMNLMEMLYLLRTFPKPTIAKVQGPALAGGCGLALACDIVVANDAAQFGFTEVRIGFVPAIVMKLLVERVGAGSARELLVRGNILTADMAMELGMVNYVVGNDELESAVERLAMEIAIKTSPEAVGLTKQLFREIESMDLREAMTHAACFNAIARTTESFRRGVNSFLNKEKLNW
jgi:methylglutaconyl-CoA hydratase